MRNISEYPVTQAEKIALLRRLITAEQEKLSNGNAPIGDMTLIVLEEILKDLYKATAFDEGISSE